MTYAITTEQLKKILAKHAEWLADNSNGFRADLSYADLSSTDLVGVNLSYANMIGVNLSYAYLDNADLSYTRLDNADLSYTHLDNTNLSYTHLDNTNLSYANMIDVNLSHADMRDANLTGVNMDYSSGIPLWCGGSKFKCDAKLIQQVLAHLCTLDCKNKEWVALRKAIRPFAKKSHRACDLGLIKQKKG
jgi:uncharacterized protein YjbI with pentapeptide repeats